ncbi:MULTISPECIES: hypothetical protein [Chryseobacterium]|uniref:Uncharacterized protein n=1 Tax=Chryseobacterium taihuense TaxID=1141221 RepID=A0A4U8WB70_9FLAO|nr:MULTISPECIES: hypothetical protein [Chryseobacterium]QQV01341.1 hypothetical protein I6I61_09485 [Chryseobacterium sp. FDAARGOS 1104]VFB02065.1 Uncharacterised protein [Chryseobacterium taihuense]
MKDEVINILNKKNLLIVGKSEIERRNFVTNIIENANYETYRFPSKMRLFEEYYDFVLKKHLYKPSYESNCYNGNQILDFHRDWIAENNSILVLEEFDFMEERWKMELIWIFLKETENQKKGENKIKVIISQESENKLIDKLSNVINIKEGERRTRRQIIEQNLELINI